jgi:integrase
MPRKNSKHLTDPGIEKIGKAPKGKRIERFDAGAPGLCLRITDKGAKSWSVYYRLNGKHQRMTIGTWPGIGVARARDRARQIKDQAKGGTDPKAAREAEERATQEAAQEEAQNTFGALAEKYINRECKGENSDGSPKLKRGREIERIIRRELLPDWQDTLITDLRKRDAVALTDALLDAGKPMAAHKLHEIIKRIFEWAHGRDEIAANPMSGKWAPVNKTPRDRVLSDKEITAIWQAAEKMGYPTGPFYRLLTLTGQRLTEVADACWSEIDLEAGVWVVPAARIKSKRDHLVPLSEAALTILTALPRFTAGNYVFSTTGGQRPISGHSRRKARLDELSGVTGWRNHDIRRTVRTGLAALGVPEIVSEHILSHGPRNPLVRTYNVHAYKDEKREALEKWAGHVRNLIEPPPKNVVRLEAQG